MGFFRGPLGKSLSELTVGEKATFTHAVTRQEVLVYMGVSGDMNPLYTDSAYAGRTRYERPIIPANLLAGMAFGAVAQLLPGRGAVARAHQYRMVNTAEVEQELTVRLEVVELRPAERAAVIRYSIANPAGQPVLSGELVVEPPAPLKPILQHAYDNF